MNRERFFEFNDQKSAAEKQIQLSSRIIEKTSSLLALRFVCGLDAAYRGAYGVGAASLWDLHSLSVVEESHIILRVSMKYVPGLLGFREGPLIVAAANMLKSSADMFLVDGHGRAHPRRFGLACHVGLALDRPTVGVAKSSLYGRMVDNEIVDEDGTVLGKIVEGEGSSVFYVSVGHKISLNDAVEVVGRSMARGHPAPLRKAHLETIRLRSELPS